MAENNNIISFFVSAAAKHPDSPAIRGKINLSYGELLEKVKSRAFFFKKRGIKKGDRVLVFVPMSENLYINVLALFYNGAVPVFVDEWVSKKRLEVCCRIAGCKAFIAPFRYRCIAFFIRELRKIPIWMSESNNESGTLAAFAQCHWDDPALITFTTGSTGIPKAAIRTHGILQAQFSALLKKTGMKNGDVVMTTLPIVLLIGLGCGATSVMAKFKPSKPWRTIPENIYSQIRKEKVNILIASPYFTLELCRKNQPSDLCLKIFTGGAPVFPCDAEKLIQTFPGSSVQVVYGSTEAEPISMISAGEIADNKIHLIYKGLAAGEIDPSAEVKIISITSEPLGNITGETWNSLLKNQGETGEIVVSGKHVVENYLNNADAFRGNKIVASGKIWHRTGDAGIIDENGKLWLAGRCKQLFFNTSGWISPFVYEAVLKSLEGITSGTVLFTEEKKIIVCELKSNESSEKIKKLINSTGLLFDKIIFLKKIPKDPRHFSKIDYDLLHKMIRKDKLIFS